jgi:hypothetical protein
LVEKPKKDLEDGFEAAGDEAPPPNVSSSSKLPNVSFCEGVAWVDAREHSHRLHNFSMRTFAASKEDGALLCWPRP